MVPVVDVQLNVGIMMMMMAVIKITVMKTDGALSMSFPPIFSSNPSLKLFTTLSRYHLHIINVTCFK